MCWRRRRRSSPCRSERNLVLAISTPRSRPGFDTAEIAHVQRPHELNYFVTSRWAAAPARMLEPLLLQALGQTEGFRAVVPAAGAVPADVVLDIELIHLRHNFEMKPSRVQLSLRAQLIDVRGKRVLAVKQFDEAENAGSDDPYGGVTAANRLVRRVLGPGGRFLYQRICYSVIGRLPGRRAGSKPRGIFRRRS
ncbi:MAG: PqiC family protein [Desulfosudis oleivorans]|nr:PqiC family protein [Desulfosudis oleivorans]